MSDRAARVDRLRAMAHQTGSPHEAAIAKRKLEAMGEPLEAPAPTAVDAMERAVRDFVGPIREDVVIRMNGRPVRRVPGPFGE